MWKKGAQKILTLSEQCIKSDKIPKMSMEKMQEESIKVLCRSRDESDDHLYRQEPKVKAAEEKDSKLKKKRREVDFLYTMVSALDAFLAEEKTIGITTNSKMMDDLFGNGGIPLGAVTELCGMAGLGKTQTCMQLCSSVQIPQDCGGVGGTSIYIDCEGSFVGSRMKSIADSTALKYRGKLTTQTILESISLVRPQNQTSFIEFIFNDLENTIRQDPRIKVIVIDSIAFFFRSFTGDYGERTRLLSLLAQKLRGIAHIYQIAVVVTNQMTTKLKSGNSNGGSLMVPAMGESWGHACTHRIILLWHNRKRCAWLCKSSTRPDGLAPYQISENGVEDVMNDDL